MKSLYLAFESYMEAFSIVKKAGFKKYYVIPGVVSIILLMIFYFVGEFFSIQLFDLLEKGFGIEKYGKVIYLFIKIVITMAVFLIYFLIYKTLLLMSLSLVLSYISEKTEEYLEGVEYKMGIRENLRLAWRSVVISSKSFIRELIGTIIVTLLSFIFPLNLLVPAILFLIQSYYTGFAFVDYTLERQKFNSEESFKFIKENKIFATTSGMIFIIFYLVPVIGIFMAPIIAVVAVTRGTLIMLKSRNS